MIQIAHKCDFCSLCFVNRFERKDHILSHFQQRICVACDKTLIRIADKWYRIEVHTDDVCNTKECDRFSQSNSMDASIEVKIEADLNDGNEIKQEVEDEISNEMECPAKKNGESDASFVDRNPLDDNEFEEESLVDDSGNLIEDDDDSDDPYSKQVKESEQLHDFSPPGEERKLEGGERIKTDEEYCVPNEEYASDHDIISTKSNLGQKSSSTTSPSVPAEHSCRVCNKIYTTAKYLRRHIRQIHADTISTPSKLYKCHLCEKVFTRKRGYNHHVSEHLAETSHKCVVCCEAFLLEKTLNIHYQRAHKITSTEQLYDCDACSLSFATFDALGCHRRQHHGSLGLQLECDECDEHLPTEQQLLAHIKRFHMDTDGRRQYICYMCPKKFCFLKNLQYHMNNHTGCRPFTCLVCERSFFNPSAMRQHMISWHRPNVIVERAPKVKEPNKHICSYCGKLFKFRCALREHLNLHTGARPYQCKICLKYFPSDRHMRNHQMTHSDRRPYVCNMEPCTRGYKELRDLRRHKFSVHGIPSETMFTCPACPKSFPDNTLFRKHMRSHENE